MSKKTYYDRLQELRAELYMKFINYCQKYPRSEFVKYDADKDTLYFRNNQYHEWIIEDSFSTTQLCCLADELLNE